MASITQSLRFRVAGVIVLIALLASAFWAFRPISRSEAVRIAVKSYEGSHPVPASTAEFEGDRKVVSAWSEAGGHWDVRLIREFRNKNDKSIKYEYINIFRINKRGTIVERLDITGEAGRHARDPGPDEPLTGVLRPSVRMPASYAR